MVMADPLPPTPAAQDKKMGRTGKADTYTQAKTIEWLKSQYAIRKGSKDSYPKSRVYEDYLDFCKANSMNPTTAPAFGKLVRIAFPSIQCRRRGRRGEAKHHYKDFSRIGGPVPSPSTDATESHLAFYSYEADSTSTSSRSKSRSPPSSPRSHKRKRMSPASTSIDDHHIKRRPLSPSAHSTENDHADSPPSSPPYSSSCSSATASPASSPPQSSSSSSRSSKAVSPSPSTTTSVSSLSISSSSSSSSSSPASSVEVSKLLASLRTTHKLPTSSQELASLLCDTEHTNSPTEEEGHSRSPIFYSRSDEREGEAGDNTNNDDGDDDDDDEATKRVMEATDKTDGERAIKKERRSPSPERRPPQQQQQQQQNSEKEKKPTPIMRMEREISLYYYERQEQIPEGIDASQSENTNKKNKKRRRAEEEEEEEKVPHSTVHDDRKGDRVKKEEDDDTEAAAAEDDDDEEQSAAQKAEGKADDEMDERHYDGHRQQPHSPQHADANQGRANPYDVNAKLRALHERLIAAGTGGSPVPPSRPNDERSRREREVIDLIKREARSERVITDEEHMLRITVGNNRKKRRMDADREADLVEAQLLDGRRYQRTGSRRDKNEEEEEEEAAAAEEEHYDDDEEGAVQALIASSPRYRGHPGRTGYGQAEDDDDDEEDEDDAEERSTRGPISMDTVDERTGVVKKKDAVPIIIRWIRQNYEVAPPGSRTGCDLLKEQVYNNYKSFCLANGIQHTNPATFGKILRTVFPSIKTRRLGSRGNTKHYYHGIRLVSPLYSIDQLSHMRTLAPAPSAGSSPSSRRAPRSPSPPSSSPPSSPSSSHSGPAPSMTMIAHAHTARAAHSMHHQQQQQHHLQQLHSHQRQTLVSSGPLAYARGPSLLLPDHSSIGSGSSPSLHSSYGHSPRHSPSHQTSSTPSGSPSSPQHYSAASPRQTHSPYIQSGFQSSPPHHTLPPLPSPSSLLGSSRILPSPFGSPPSPSFPPFAYSPPSGDRRSPTSASTATGVASSSAASSSPPGHPILPPLPSPSSFLPPSLPLGSAVGAPPSPLSPFSRAPPSPLYPSSSAPLSSSPAAALPQLRPPSFLWEGRQS